METKYAENVRKSDPENKGGMCMLETVDVPGLEKWVKEQIDFLEKTLYEMRPLGQ